MPARRPPPADILALLPHGLTSDGRVIARVVLYDPDGHEIADLSVPPPGPPDPEGATATPTGRRLVTALASARTPLYRKQLFAAAGVDAGSGHARGVLAALVRAGVFSETADGLLAVATLPPT